MFLNKLTRSEYPLYPGAEKVECPTMQGPAMRFTMHAIYFDSMVYPIFSVGAMLYVVVCALYLFTLQAPPWFKGW